MRFLMSVAIIMVSITLFALDMATPHAQAANAPAPNCISAIPSLVPGTPVSAPTAPGTLFINEVLTNPNTAWNCADLSPSTNDAWIELYNAQNQPVDLSSSHTEIDIGPAEYAYILPTPSVIAPLSFLVVFPQIGSDTSTIPSVQLRIGGTTIDSVSVPTLLPDQSYARIPDGGKGIWQISNYPTPGASNRLAPPTPTPTPTKTPKISIPRTKAPRTKLSNSSSRSNSNSSSSSGQSNTTADPTSNSTDDSLINDGVQPSWRTLQLPGGTTAPSPTLASATVTPSSTTPQQSTDTSDLPKKVIISVSVIVLAFALLWCWKHFLSP